MSPTSDCTVAFGSSNDTSMLRMLQSDHAATAFVTTPNGAYDTSFNGTGTRIVAVDATATDGATWIAAQPDGRLVTVGSSNGKMAVTRFTAAGAPDPTFGVGGTTLIDPSGGGEAAYHVAVQTDGKVLIAGNVNNVFTVVRLTGNGVLDTTFGTGGITSIASLGADAWSVMELAGGAIVACGRGPTVGGGFRAVRLTSGGALDPSFGSSGIASFATGVGGRVGYRCDLQSSGRIVMTGFTSNGTNNDIVVGRFTADGRLDTTFGTGGSTTLPIGSGHDTAYQLAVQADDKIVVAGGSIGASTGYDIVIARFTASGAPDTSFGTNGATTTPLSTTTDLAYGLALQEDGRAVVSGYSSAAGVQDQVILRYTTAGILDPTFAAAGVLVTSMGTTGSDQASGVVIVDGSIATTGYAIGAGGQDTTVVKLAPGASVADYQQGVSDWTTGSVGAFGACLRSVATGGVTDGTTWTPNSTCPLTDGAWWHRIPVDPGRLCGRH